MMRRGLWSVLLIIAGVFGFWIAATSELKTSALNLNEPALASHSLAITPDGETLLVVNPDSNSVTLIATDLQIASHEITVGKDPRSVAALEDRAFIANQGSDSISILNLETRTLAGSIRVGDRPAALAISPGGRFMAVAETGSDTIRFLETSSYATLAILPVADRPYGLSFTPDGRYLLVSHLLSGAVTRLSVQPYRAFLPQMSTQPWYSGLSLPDGLGSGGDLPHISIPTWPGIAPAPAVVVSQAGLRAYLPQTMAHGQGFNLQFDTTVFPRVSVLNLETWSHQTSEHISLPEIDRPVGLPWDIALAKNDTELWVVNSASNDVSVVDISNPYRPGRVANIPVGDNPRAILLSPDEQIAYVNNHLAGTVSVLDTDLYTVTRIITSTQIPLPPVLLNGKRLFHSSALPELSQASWISCNTCHIEGEQDGRTWMLQYLGEVPLGATPVITRNTTSLLGMIQTYPLRWSAEWDESADSEFSIRFEQFGTGLIEADMYPTLGQPNQGRSYQLDSLAAYIDSLALPEASRTLSQAEQRGKLVFESDTTACASCHPSPLYTDLQVHDVGTAAAFGEWFGPQIDTPSLNFLGDSAPYLHDGSAGTLGEVLVEKNPANEHGMTSNLTSEEIDDLIAFLLALPYQGE
jgi:YVTN family beta-propeller protein